MGRVTVDFSEVQEFEPLEKGEYDGVIEKVTFVEPASEDKYPYLNVEINITENGYDNRKAFLVWSLSPKALFRMKQDFENLGIVSEEDEVDIDVDEDTELVTNPELAGLPVVVVCDKPRSYEGRLQNNVVMLRSPDGPAPAAKKTGAKKTTAKKTTRKFK